jgi:putative hemolysin
LDLPTDHGIPEFLVRWLGLRTAEDYYLTLPTAAGLAASADRILTDRGYDLSVVHAAASCIPQHGALLITSNHPTGILDGVLLLAALLARRSDVRVVANEVLRRIPVLTGHVISIRKTDSQPHTNRNALLAIRRAWKREECVIAFPAGTVAHWQWREMGVADAPWAEGIQRFAARLGVSECRATLTVKNPLWFHGCAAISRKARIALLLRAFLASAGIPPAHPVGFKLLDDSSISEI